jgi:hypothetical protein
LLEPYRPIPAMPNADTMVVTLTLAPWSRRPSQARGRPGGRRWLADAAGSAGDQSGGAGQVGAAQSVRSRPKSPMKTRIPAPPASSDGKRRSAPAWHACAPAVTCARTPTPTPSHSPCWLRCKVDSCFTQTRRNTTPCVPASTPSWPTSVPTWVTGGHVDTCCHDGLFGWLWEWEGELAAWVESSFSSSVATCSGLSSTRKCVASRPRPVTCSAQGRHTSSTSP